MQEGKRFSGNGMNWKIKSLIDNMIRGIRLSREFFIRDVLDVAPEMPGKIMVIRLSDGTYRQIYGY